MIIYQNIPYILFFIILQLVLRDKPEHPPSAVAAAPPSEQSFCKSLREMWANKNFMILAVGYALIYGVYCAIGANMSNLMNPFGYSPTQISIIGGTCLLSGLICALLIGWFLDYTSLYRKTHVTLSLMAFISIIITAVVLATSDESSLLKLVLAIVLFGISGVSFFPTSLSYGAELTFPLQPALVNACMNFLG